MTGWATPPCVPTAPATSAHQTLGVVRAGVGVFHLACPGAFAHQLIEGQLSDGARNVVRVLGARQVAQALASGRTPTRAVLYLGAEVDIAHATSMIVLAVIGRRYRRAALSDAAVAAAFAVAGLAAARSAPYRAARMSPLGAWRDRCAERLARVIVPGYPAGSALGGSGEAGPEEHEETQ